MTIKMNESDVAMIAIVLQEVVKRKVFKENETYSIFNLDGTAKAQLHNLAIYLDQARRSKKKRA